MDEFTEQELHAIDDMHRRNLEGLTSDEVQLLVRYNQAIALQTAKFQAEQERANAEMKARIEQSETQTNAALDMMRQMRNAAIARLERVENG